jgi:hypothetical protein
MEHEILGGEVWMDERGEAVVVLPDHLHGRELEYECRLHCAGSTRACAGLSDGRLTITSSLPHLKVAWRLVGAARRAIQPRGEDVHPTINPVTRRGFS